MKTECYFCHQKTLQKLIKKFSPDEKTALDFVFSVHDLLGKSQDVMNPELATYIHRIAREQLSVADLYAEEKETANALLLSDKEFWRSFIDNQDDPFAAAAKLAVVGNIIDYGAHSLKGDLLEQIKSLYENPLRVNETAELKEALSKASSVLYLGDNAGEVFFDKLFIQTIKHPNMTFATRGVPVINDITQQDAYAMGIDQYCKVIDNGYDAPSTLLEHCSESFLEAYHSADLIISKGQGNFEGLMGARHPNTYFMLIAKCAPIGELLGVESGSMIIRKGGDFEAF